MKELMFFKSRVHARSYTHVYMKYLSNIFSVYTAHDCARICFRSVRRHIGGLLKRCSLLYCVESAAFLFVHLQMVFAYSLSVCLFNFNVQLMLNSFYNIIFKFKQEITSLTAQLSAQRQILIHFEVKTSSIRKVENIIRLCFANIWPPAWLETSRDTSSNN